MKYFLPFFAVFQLGLALAQDQISLTPEEKAYLYHIVRKSPILDTNIGRYFEYRGPIVRYQNKEVNFDSIENVIINQPEQLFIRSSEIAKSPKGIIAEATNKMALWELNKVLLAKRQGKKELENYRLQYARFVEILKPRLPYKAMKEEEGEMIPHPKLDQLLNPTLNFNDKKELISTYHFLDIDEQIETLKALNDAVNIYVEERSLELFRILGGEASYYKNALVAAGDGSPTSGMLEEREKDERGRWNKGLPKAVGLFPYQIEKKPGDKKTKPSIEPLRFATLDFETVGGNKKTNIHPDVWGYNANKQTTVVIEKNGLSYHLFGSADTRFLSPDSNFASGTTFQAVINELEFDKIAKLEEKISGKKGFDYWIDYNIKKRDETEMKIEKHEKTFSDLGYTPITTSSKASRQVKKQRRKQRKAGNNKPIDYQPTTYANGKKRKSEQQEIIDLYNLFEMYKKKIEDLKKEKQEAVDLMTIYQRRLGYYKELMGFRWAEFTEEDGLYTFQDSTTFDIYTQEFTFPPSAEKVGFEVRLLAIPGSALSDMADEVMLHVNVTDAKPNFDARLQIELQDVFASNKWDLNRQLVSPVDSVAVMQLFEALKDKKMEIDIIARGQGVGKWDGVRTVKLNDPVELSDYPGSSQEDRAAAKDDTTFLRLRKSEAFVFLNRGIHIEVNSYTDPVKSNMEVSPEFAERMSSYKLSKNQILSAYRSASVLLKLKDELNVLAGAYLPREEAKKVIDRLNGAIAKTKISVGATSFKLDELK